LKVGWEDGSRVGRYVGIGLGLKVGMVVGLEVGWEDGTRVGLNVGLAVGLKVGGDVGGRVELLVGDLVGFNTVGFVDSSASDWAKDAVVDFEAEIRVGRLVFPIISRGVGLMVGGLDIGFLVGNEIRYKSRFVGLNVGLMTADVESSWRCPPNVMGGLDLFITAGFSSICSDLDSETTKGRTQRHVKAIRFIDIEIFVNIFCVLDCKSSWSWINIHFDASLQTFIHIYRISIDWTWKPMTSTSRKSGP
jgi:hypothetical protein